MPTSAFRSSSKLSILLFYYSRLLQHNFEHAIHVVQSSQKLLTRVVAAQEMGSSDGGDCTFGIASDPLTQFAVIFAALIQ